MSNMTVLLNHFLSKISKNCTGKCIEYSFFEKVWKQCSSEIDSRDQQVRGEGAVTIVKLLI